MRPIFDLQEGIVRFLATALTLLVSASSFAGTSEDRFRLVAAMAQEIKGMMRDPDSIIFESTLSNEDATVICIRYRAKNGFGGMNREVMAYANGKASKEPGFYKANCSRDGMIDMREASEFARRHKE